MDLDVTALLEEEEEDDLFDFEEMEPPPAPGGGGGGCGGGPLKIGTAPPPSSATTAAVGTFPNPDPSSRDPAADMATRASSGGELHLERQHREGDQERQFVDEDGELVAVDAPCFRPPPGSSYSSLRDSRDRDRRGTMMKSDYGSVEQRQHQHQHRDQHRRRGGIIGDGRTGRYDGGNRGGEGSTTRLLGYGSSSSFNGRHAGAGGGGAGGGGMAFLLLTTRSRRI